MKRRICAICRRVIHAGAEARRNGRNPSSVHALDNRGMRASVCSRCEKAVRWTNSLSLMSGNLDDKVVRVLANQTANTALQIKSHGGER